jgi:hypothetical protein
MRLEPSDLAVLEAQQPRNDLQCAISATKPTLDFDFTFHTGYQIKLPLGDLAGNGNVLTILFRVNPQDHPDNPVYMVQRMRVPPISEDRGGHGEIDGGFALGEGNYHVDWMMRDQEGRVCASTWDLEAKLGPKDGALKPWIHSGFVRPLETTPFVKEPPVQRDQVGDLLKVDVIVNIGPQDPDASVLHADDLRGLAGILQRIALDPHIGQYSLIVCSLRTHQILYREQNVSGIDLPAVGESLKSLHLGLIDVKQMALKPAQFVADLVNEQAKRQGQDALIIVGPKYGWEASLPRDIRDSLEDLNRPVFYLNYDLAPYSHPWQDLIGKVVKQKRGIQYTITGPKDLFKAWSDVVFRMLKAKHPQSEQKANMTSGL